MRKYRLAAVAIFGLAISSAALADDPRDPAMQGSAARQQDAELVRKLNQQENDRVRERDAAYSKGNSNTQNYAKAKADYDRDYAQYERDMAKWRRATAACRSRDKSSCAR